MFRRLVLTAFLPLILQPNPASAQGNSGGGGNRGGGNGNQGNGNQGNGNRGQGNQGNGNQGSGNQGRGNQGNGNQGGGNRGGGRFAGQERDIVQNWLSANPGFTVQPLPPGMRNRLAQGKALPPGIARRTVPPGLISQLPPRPGYSYAYVGATLVLIEIATGAVADILEDILLR